MRRRYAVPLLLLLAGCTSLRKSTPIETLSLAGTSRDKYQVWTHGLAHVLIAVRLDQDTLSGVPYWKPPACDSCRLAIPRTTVDSVRVKSFDPNRTLLLGIILTPIVVLMYAFRGMGDSNY